MSTIRYSHFRRLIAIPHRPFIGGLGVLPPGWRPHKRDKADRCWLTAERRASCSRSTGPKSTMREQAEHSLAYLLAAALLDATSG